MIDESVPPPTHGTEQDLFNCTQEAQELYLVCKHVDACGTRGIKLPLKKSDKVLLHRRGKDGKRMQRSELGIITDAAPAMWFRDTKGRSSVLSAEAVRYNLMNMMVEEIVTGSDLKGIQGDSILLQGTEKVP